MRASSGGPRQRAANAHRATELETDSRYDGCEPGYASFIEALGAVYCGDLDRYVELTAAVAQEYGRERGYAIAAYVDGLQSSGRIEEALSLTEESVAVARNLGNPYWVAYALWIVGMALSKADVVRAFAAWDEGVAFVHEHRVQFFEGFLARDAARLHASDGEADTALVLFAQAITAFQRVGNVPQLVITLASVPALFERLDRLAPAALLLGALARQESSLTARARPGRPRGPHRHQARPGACHRARRRRRRARPQRRRELRPSTDRGCPPRAGAAHA